MPKIKEKVQLLIPCSRFKIGELVHYTIDFQKTRITYFGEVESRSWIDQCDRSYWEYIVTTQYLVQDSAKFWSFEDRDCVLESNLKPWDGSKSSVKTHQ